MKPNSPHFPAYIMCTERGMLAVAPHSASHSNKRYFHISLECMLGLDLMCVFPSKFQRHDKMNWNWKWQIYPVNVSENLHRIHLQINFDERQRFFLMMSLPHKSHRNAQIHAHKQTRFEYKIGFWNKHTTNTSHERSFIYSSIFA